MAAAEAALKERERDDRDDEITRLKSKVGEMTMEIELLRDKIARHGVHAAPKRLDRVHGLLRAFADHAIVHDHVGAFLRETNGHGLTDALSASGDECNLACEFHRAFLR